MPRCLCESSSMTPLSDDALPPVVWFDASSSSSSSPRVYPVSTTLSRAAENWGFILAHLSLSCSLVSVSWRCYPGCNTSSADAIIDSGRRGVHVLKRNARRDGLYLHRQHCGRHQLYLVAGRRDGEPSCVSKMFREPLRLRCKAPIAYWTMRCRFWFGLTSRRRLP